MVNRKIFPAEHGCEIKVTTERMKDGTWGLVVTVRRSTEPADQDTDLPDTHERFGNEAEAEAYGVQMAREWIADNVSPVA